MTWVLKALWKEEEDSVDMPPFPASGYVGKAGVTVFSALALKFQNKEEAENYALTQKMTNINWADWSLTAAEA
jgi:hypothetical protein